MYPWPMCHTCSYVSGFLEKLSYIWSPNLPITSGCVLSFSHWQSLLFFLWLLFWDNGVGGYVLISFNVIVNVFFLNSTFDKQGGVLILLCSAVCLLIKGLCCVHRNIKITVLVTWRDLVVEGVNHFRQRLCSSSLCDVVFRHRSFSVLQVIAAETQSWLMTNVYVGDAAATPILTELFLECDMFEKTLSAVPSASFYSFIFCSNMKKARVCHRDPV